MTEATINAQYAVSSQESGQRFPAIQASTYRPSKSSEAVSLVLSEDSYDLILEGLSTHTPEAVFSPIECEYNDGEVVGMFSFPSDVRFVVLAMPRIFGLDKETGEVSPLRKGEKLSVSGRRTVAKILLGVLHNDEFLKNADGEIQVFTLKLTSSKTALIGSDRDKGENRTIHKMNKALQERLKMKNQWLTHLVSLEISVKPETFKSQVTGESSKGVLFVLGDSCRVLSEENQKTVFDLISTEDFQELAKNPFGDYSKPDSGEPAVSAPANSSEIPW